MVRRLVLGAFSLAAVGLACSGRQNAGDTLSDASTPVGSRLDAAIHPAAPCLVTIDAPLLLPGQHVPVGSAVTYNSNPPSSGPHYPVWAAFTAYSSPVPRPYYVHNLEHGAIVLLSRCADATACAAATMALQAVSDALPTDPLCSSSGQGVRVRTVITPDPLLDVPYAAAAWGWTYKAECLDLPTLTQFARDHYGQGTEAVCTNGQAQF